MPHFFISSKSYKDGYILINDKENYNHIARSLRIRKNEKLLLIDENAVQYETFVVDVNEKEIKVKVTQSYKSSRGLNFDLYLAQSPLRSDAQSFVVEKATELGIKGLYPVRTDNCALAEDVILKKVDKWQKIMYEASKQCERAFVPVCYQPDSIENLMKKFDRVIVFCERRTSKTLKDIAPVKHNENLLVIIGPEGGFSEREFDFFESQNFEMLTLGNLILKAETAVTVALGNIIYEFN